VGSLLSPARASRRASSRTSMRKSEPRRSMSNSHTLRISSEASLVLPTKRDQARPGQARSSRLVFGLSDPALNRRLRRAHQQGKLREVATRLYSSDSTTLPINAHSQELAAGGTPPVFQRARQPPLLAGGPALRGGALVPDIKVHPQRRNARSGHAPARRAWRCTIRDPRSCTAASLVHEVSGRAIGRE
jgi:hypothetical protein